MSDKDEGAAYLSVREAARRLGVHENTIRNWARRGLVRPVELTGSRYRRFRVDEIEQLVREQERATRRARQREGSTEFVDADYLDKWGRGAERLLPQVVRRLIAGTQGVSGLSMRAAGGVALPGWDGLVEESQGDAWVPRGPSAWEIGTGGNPERKGQEDYDKRTADPLGVEPSVTTFVFVTPRRWPAARGWERDRRAEGKWKGVRVIDGDDLAGWLETQPATHLWLSEQLGFRPFEVRTLAHWWEQFRAKTEPALPAALLRAGREDVIARLERRLELRTPGAIFLRAPSREEVIAFVAAALETAADQAPPPLVALSSTGWQRLSISDQPAILIPDLDEAHLSEAIGKGHAVIAPLAAGAVAPRQEVIELPPVDRHAAREAFQSLGFSFEEADRLGALARRSLSSLVRDPQLVSGPRGQPPWAEGDHGRALACLVLAGAWTETESDQQVAAAIADRSWSNVERELTTWVTTSDPPFILSGGNWEVASPEGAWTVLHAFLQTSDIRRFCQQATQVLEEVDPSLALDREDQPLAAVRGIQRRWSGTLRTGLAQGLALLGAFDERLADGTSGADYANRVVRELLGAANADETGKTWASLSSELRLLAEAAPSTFLDAVETGLSGKAPVLANVFQDEKDVGWWNASSPHTGLLWGLELLCWSPDWLSRAAEALARLAELDPDGRLANRPASSLRTVFLPWIPRTSASLERRLTVFDRLRRAHPGVAWKLGIALLPRSHDTSSNTPVPRFRRWELSEEGVPVSEWLAAVEGLVSRLIDDAASDGDRWVELLSHIESLPPEQSSSVISRLEDVASELTNSSGRTKLWETLVELVGRHRSGRDERWSLPSEPLNRLDAVAESIEPEDLVARYARLFDWHPYLPGVDPTDYAGHEAAVSEARKRAISRILETSGLRGIERLADTSEIPLEVGSQLAIVAGQEHARRMLDLATSDGVLGALATGWVRRSYFEGGSAWLAEMGATAQTWPQATQVAFLLALGDPNSEVVALLETLHASVQALYWETVRPLGVDGSALEKVVDQLLGHGRAWVALDVLSLACSPRRKGEKRPSPEQVIATLDAALTAESSERARRGSDEYEVTQLLDFLEREEVDEDGLARFEWSFFQLLEHTRQPRALYAGLAQNPDLYVDMVCRAYRAKDSSDAPETDASTLSVVRNAWSVLNDWRRPPGVGDEGFIDAQHLRSWVRRVRLLLADRDREEIGDELIGQLLSGSPPAPDGTWPAEEVRELIEDLGSRHLDIGLAVGVRNARGITSRAVYEGGAQEWALSRQYRSWAETVMDRWPRTGRLLTGLAESFEQEARREDAEAHARANEI